MHITYFVAIVGPAAKLHVAVLVVEWEPSDVDLAGGLEDARRDVGQHPSVPDHNLDWISAVKCFVGAAKHTQKPHNFRFAGQFAWPQNILLWETGIMFFMWALAF